MKTCWVPAFWKEKSWNVDYILAQALRWHVSTLNVKSSAIPPEWRQKFEEFQKRMGYRLVLRRFEYPRRARAGAMMPVRMWWLNAGVAPPYRAYEVALQIEGNGAAEILTLPADVRGWLPGDAVYDGSVYVPGALGRGAYRLRLALLDPRTRRPAVRLAIKGRAKDGWYDLGPVEVE